MKKTGAKITKKHIKEPCRKCKGIHHTIGIEVEDGLGEKLTRDKYDECADDCFYNEPYRFVGHEACRLEQILVDDLSHEYAVNNKRDVVAYEQG